MSKGFAIESGEFVIRNGTRITATTAGRLTGFLPTAVNLTQSLVFPDPSKGYLYHWEWQSDFTVGGGGAYGYAMLNDVQITALPQEYGADVVLMAVPPNANMFWGHIELSRIGAPSHTWMGLTIDPLVPMGVKIPVSGSLFMEAGIGMTRELTVMISGGNLVARIEQSISVAPGGWGYYGDGSVANSNDSAGGENVNGGIHGIPVFRPGVPPYYNFFSGTLAGSFPTPAGIMGTFRRGGSNQASVTDMTNYSSTYSAIVTGHFGLQS